MCRINYDSDQGIKQNEVPESRMRFRWAFGSSSEVLSKLTEKSRSLPKKLIGTHQEDYREVQELVESPLEHCQEIVGSSVEDHWKLMVRPSVSAASGSTARLGGGTAQCQCCKQWYR